MNEAWNFEQCALIFRQEITLLQKIMMIHNSVQTAVMNREWTDFDWKTAELNQLGDELTGLENSRIEILDALKDKLHVQPDDVSFYTLAAGLPADECRELTGLYRELKMEILQIKTQNEVFTGYLNEIKTVTTAWLEAIFPVQGGKLYTRKGRQAEAGQHSMVLNQRI